LESYPNLSDLQTYEGVHIDSIKISIFDITDSNWYAVGSLFVENAFDTFCRMGSGRSTYLRGQIATDFNEVASFYFNVLKRHGYFLSFRDDLNYTYLDHSDSNSRPTGITIFEKDLLEFERTSPSDPAISAAIVRGGGPPISLYLGCGERTWSLHLCAI